MNLKKGLLFFLLLLFPVFLVVGWRGWQRVQQPTPAISTPSTINDLQVADRSKITVSVGNKPLTIEVVNTLASITLGLSGRESIGSDGMLFVLPQQTIPTFWMKEMKFALDMVWIQDGKVVEVTANVHAPDHSIPLNELPLYSPKQPVEMVLEVPAGKASEWGLVPGAEILRKWYDRSMSAAQTTPSLFSRVRTSFTQPVPRTVPMADPTSQVVPQFQAANDELTLLEEAIAEAEQTKTPQALPTIQTTPAASLTTPPLDVVAQAVPTVIAQQTDTLNPSTAKPLAKEAWQVAPPPAEVPLAPEPLATETVPVAEVQPIAETPTASEQGTENVIEAGQHVQYTEIGPVSPEIPVEIESYLQEVKSHQEQLPQEIVVAGDQVDVIPQAPPLRPVVVVPITPEVENEGAKKPPSWSVRWLVEWSRKLMKMFAGKIVYRESESK